MAVVVLVIRRQVLARSSRMGNKFRKERERDRMNGQSWQSPLGIESGLAGDGLVQVLLLQILLH